MTDGNETTASVVPDATPDQQLATKIVAKLIDDGFIPQARKEPFNKKLETGQLKAEDWRTLAAATLRNTSQKGAE